jgi:polysaccharide pyruvyl transferase WcaK-like protein
VRAAGRPPRHILLRSSWQTVNIGDIAHTPGLLRELEQHLPDAKVTLWPNPLDRGVAEMLRRIFPKLSILNPADKEEIARAFDACDFMLHGSGPSVVGQAELSEWHAKTKKPFGVMGVTLDTLNARLRDLLPHAAFVFCRDTDSLKYLKEAGVSGPVMEFAPDSTFTLHLRDDAKAAAFLAEKGLEPGKFICAVPRLRYTPYARYAEAERKRRAAVSEQFAQVDHAKLREAIVAWVRKTGLKVLCCPEMTYQVELIPSLLIDPLPEDVKRNVVRRDTYWLTDEAASVYAQAHAVVSFEMHSPIIAVVNGTPAIHLRQPTDTRKGQMWRDVGLGDWLFEIDKASGAEIATALLGVHADYEAAKKKVAGAMAFVRERQKSAMAVLARSA